MGNLPSALSNASTVAGYYVESAAQMWPPKPTFSVAQIPDLSGRVVIVTGGNTGIGKETVKALLEHNARVYLAARSRSKADAAIADLRAVTGREAIFLELDLANLASVRTAAEEFLSKEKELHILFNNAGVMWAPLDQFTADGYDMQHGTNVLGHFFFTELLLPALTAGAKTSPDGYARVVTTSSNGAYGGYVDYSMFREGPTRLRAGTMQVYFNSKLMNGIVAHEAAKRYADRKILSFSCNPGAITSELQRYNTPWVRDLSTKYLLYPTPYGALTQLYAATMPEAIQHNGEYFIPFARVGKCRAEMYDAQVGKELWTYLEEQLQGR